MGLAMSAGVLGGGVGESIKRRGKGGRRVQKTPKLTILLHNLNHNYTTTYKEAINCQLLVVCIGNKGHTAAATCG